MASEALITAASININQKKILIDELEKKIISLAMTSAALNKYLQDHTEINIRNAADLLQLTLEFYPAEKKVNYFAKVQRSSPDDLVKSYIPGLVASIVYSVDSINNIEALSSKYASVAKYSAKFILGIFQEYPNFATTIGIPHKDRIRAIRMKKFLEIFANRDEEVNIWIGQGLTSMNRELAYRNQSKMDIEKPQQTATSLQSTCFRP